MPSYLVESYLADSSVAAGAARERAQLAASLPSITAPTLVIAELRDELFTPALLRGALVGQIAGARLSVVDRGHEIPLERPRELAALIEAFLAGLREYPPGAGVPARSSLFAVGVAQAPTVLPRATTSLRERL